MNLIETKKLHDKLYKQGEEILEKYGNPCTIGENNTCKHSYFDFCCSDCEYLSSAGCTTKNLLCKLWLCREVNKDFPEAWKELKLLLGIAYNNKLIAMRKPVSEVIKRKIKRNLNIPYKLLVYEESLSAALDLLI